MLAGSKQQIRASYQGINFFIPFFFLLVDSSLESAAASFVAGGLAGAASPLPAGADAAELVELEDTGGVPPSGAGAGVPAAVGLTSGTLALGASEAGAFVSGVGLTVVPGAFVSGDAAAGVVAG